MNVGQERLGFRWFAVVFGGPPQGPRLALAQTVAIRLHALVMLAVLAMGGCVTTTAHRLPIQDSPMSRQAIACEAKCHELLGPSPGQDCRSTPDVFRETCQEFPESGGDAYAACLDSCPGATAIDGASCDRDPDAICRETSKPHWGGIAAAVAIPIMGMLLIRGVAE